MDKSAKIDHYFSEDHHFKVAIGVLRDLALKTKMQETYKWRLPTYTLADRNVMAIGKFKKHFGIWFFNGVFLSDPYNVLENAQEGKTQSMRHWKFYNLEEIDKDKVLDYMHEALENQKKGLKLIPNKIEPIEVLVPELLQRALSGNKVAKKAFQELSPYNQKEYSKYITSAKQEKTKLSRLEKILPMISSGAGLNDRYR